MMRSFSLPPSDSPLTTLFLGKYVSSLMRETIIYLNTGGDMRHTLMPRGFAHDDGWFEILWRLCGDLEPLLAQFEREAAVCQFEVLQGKEKSGGLRIHVTYANDAIPQRIEAAKKESFHICEVCGQSGTLREGQWIKTLCDDHAGARGAREIGW
jgi:hypothetical protein